MDFLYNKWVWIAVSLAGFALCAFLPIWIKDDALLKKVSWFVLVPVSVILIVYAYPAGLEVFRRMALTS